MAALDIALLAALDLEVDTWLFVVLFSAMLDALFTVPSAPRDEALWSPLEMSSIPPKESRLDNMLLRSEEVSEAAFEIAFDTNAFSDEELFVEEELFDDVKEPSGAL